MKVLWVFVLNQFKLILFTACLGAIAGAIVWGFMKLVSLATVFIWDVIPGQVNHIIYPVIVCVLGGLLIGIIRKKSGDYPEELNVVMSKIKRDKHYDYKPMLAMIICAFLPFIIGASVGPEAGLTGIIAGLCYWVGDNIRYARKNVKEFSKIGEAVTLGVIFGAPLFGIFAVEDEPTAAEFGSIRIPRPSKWLLYAVALCSAMLVMWLFRSFVGSAGSGLPALGDVSIAPVDYIMLLIYIPIGIGMYLLFEFSEKITAKISQKIPDIIREMIGGAILGVVGILFPLVMFSGEEEMGALESDFGMYAPILLIAIGVIKIFMTALCIRFGLKGGHFFPVIFSCVCMGYGVAMLVFDNSAEHLVFSAGIITAVMLGAQIRKPLVVSMLLLLCFPVRMILIIFCAAAIGSQISKWITKKKHGEKIKLV